MGLFRSTYFIRLLAFSLILGVGPVLFLGIASYAVSSQAIQSQVNTANLQVLRQMQNSIEQIFELTDSTAIQFIDSSLVTDALQTNVTPNDFRMTSELSSGLTHIQATDLFREVSFYNLKYGWQLADSGRLTRSSNGFAEDEVVQTIKQSLAGSAWTHDSANIYLAKKRPINTPEPAGMIVVKIPLSQLSAFISKSHTGVHAIMDQSGKLITSGDPETGAWLESTFPSLVSGMNQGEGLIPYSIDGKKMTILYSKSDYNRWTYLTVISVSEITKQSRAIGWLTFWIGLALVLAAFAFSVFGSRKMYSPIRALYSTVSESLLPENGKMNELSVIGDRVQTMIVTQRQMELDLKKSHFQLRDLFAIKLFQGEYKAKDIEDRMEYLRMERIIHPYHVLVLQIDTLEGTGYEHHDFELLMYGVGNITFELFPPERTLIPVLLGSSQVTLISGASSDLEELKREVYELSAKLQEAIEHFLRMKVSIGVSSPYSELKDASKAYKEGLEALEYRIQLGGKAILFFEDVKPDRVRLEYPKQAETELLEAIRKLNAEEARHQLRLIVQQVISEVVMPEAYRLSLLRLFLELMDMIRENGLYEQMNLPDQQVLLSQLFSLPSAADMDNWFYGVLVEPAIGLLQEHMRDQYSTISGKVVHMIETELENDLTLEMCADRLGLNADYVGRVFRKEMGITFTEYLLGFRLQVAKKWLTETDMKIAEIAERLRYNSSASFIRYFRKMEGVTPGQFRQQLGKEE
ncbi:helix-turn-helix domain-containing protein [Paenibacillus thalictri]|uniref:AraC family transcriptional regulator n=1 Tax=Paenibacillus thalictri TaxID=2527873 RepID=A0A4Q9DGC5_9BACL|nr:helix-turn-helix domain-containing protein [Paenibacillus thalictri]TBL70742.1 AraC family transcriptional regulator [Paenibacillus thalictri]